MTSTPEASAPFPVRSSISSLWTSRRKKHNPLSDATSQTPQNAQNGAPGEKVVKAGFSSLQKNGANGALDAKRKGGREAGRNGDEEPRKRDDEAEVWGFEASMGVGAGKAVKKEDREEILRGRILGKRRREEANGKEKGKDGKDGKGDEGDSDEEVGRSALGRKKRAPRVDIPRPAKEKKVAEGEGEAGVSGADADTEMKEAEEKTEETVGKESDGIESSTPASDTPLGESKKQKKKKNKKKRKAAAE